MDVEKLLRELTALDGMLWVIGGGELVSENSSRGMKEPDLSDGYATIEADNWHFHLKLDSVAGAQFVEASDPHHLVPNLYYLRLSDGSEETMLRIYFPNPHLDENDNPTQFQPERLKLFEEVRDAYVGQEEIIFVRR